MHIRPLSRDFKNNSQPSLSPSLTVKSANSEAKIDKGMRRLAKCQISINNASPYDLQQPLL